MHQQVFHPLFVGICSWTSPIERRGKRRGLLFVAIGATLGIHMDDLSLSENAGNDVILIGRFKGVAGWGSHCKHEDIDSFFSSGRNIPQELLRGAHGLASAPSPTLGSIDVKGCLRYQVSK
jgi:hypothetical protein